MKIPFTTWPLLATLTVAGVSLAGCAQTPLKIVLDRDAPGYERKSPPSADSELGRHLSGEQTVTNVCFEGKLASSKRYESWKEDSLHYKGAGDAKLTADFGKGFIVDVTGKTDRDLRVTLKNVQIRAFDSVDFKPNSTCASTYLAQDPYPSHTTHLERVITRALWANSIDISDVTSSSAGLSLNPAVVGGNGAQSSDAKNKGGGIYFAHRPETIEVTKDTKKCEVTEGTDQGCELLGCGLTKIGVKGDGRWQATLSCEGGERFQLKGGARQWDFRKTAAGVSYSASITQLQDMTAETRLVRWTTSTVSGN